MRARPHLLKGFLRGEPDRVRRYGIRKARAVLDFGLREQLQKVVALASERGPDPVDFDEVVSDGDDHTAC